MDTPFFYFFTNFYPRPPRGGRRDHQRDGIAILEISIHALREEGDQELAHGQKKNSKFLSTPSARRATEAVEVYEADKLFLSTPSARRATLAAVHRRVRRLISIHALREEGDRRRRSPFRSRPISIHALREEGDRHQCRRRQEVRNISIHALREEGDLPPPASRASS